MADDSVAVSDAPAIRGLTFRRFRGESDYPGMFAVLVAHAVADDVGYPGSVAELAARYRNLRNCDPGEDMIFAEVAGDLVGYSRGSWWDDPATGRIYEMNGFLVPEWRRRRIGGAMLRWMEARLRDVAATHPADLAKHFHVHAAHSQVGAAALLEGAGYQPARYFFEMVRSLAGEISEAPLPDGLDVRPALPEHYKAIWAQGDETSCDEWGYVPTTE
jgi:mycothiol synthase